MCDRVISGVANEIPALVKQMVAHALEGDFAKARPIQERILPLMTGNFIESNLGPQALPATPHARFRAFYFPRFSPEWH